MVGTVIYHHMSGQTTVDSYAQPIERDSLLKIASCSKLVTAIAALQCVERGLITLDEPVYGVLPELSALMIATGEGMEQTKEPINLRKLLTHSSGLVYASQRDKYDMLLIYPLDIILSLHQHSKQPSATWIGHLRIQFPKHSTCLYYSSPAKAGCTHQVTTGLVF